MLDSNERLLHESFDRLRRQEHYVVRLGCSPGVLGAYGPALLEDFAVAHPNVSVSAWESNDSLCETGLRDGSYDLALCVAPITADCAGMALYESPMYFWLRRDLPVARRLNEAGRDTLRIEDLEGCDVAIPSQGYKCADHLSGLAAGRGVQLGRLVSMPDILSRLQLRDDRARRRLLERHANRPAGFYVRPTGCSLSHREPDLGIRHRAS